MTDDTVYDCFPLGKSLREHMASFALGMRAYIDTCDPGTRAPLTVLREQLENLLAFHDRESAHYGIDPADLTPGTWQAKVFAVEVCGVHSVQLWIGVGETPIAAPVFDLDIAQRLARGIDDAIAIGLGEMP